MVLFFFQFINQFVVRLRAKDTFCSNSFFFFTEGLLPPLVVIIPSELFPLQQGGFFTWLFHLSVNLPPCFAERLPAELKALQVTGLSFSRLCCQRTCWLTLLAASSSGRREGREGGREKNRGKSRGFDVSGHLRVLQFMNWDLCLLRVKRNLQFGDWISWGAGGGPDRLKIKLFVFPVIHIPAAFFRSRAQAADLRAALHRRLRLQ